MSGEQYSPAGSGEHLQRMVQDWYYTPSGPPPGGAAVWDAQPHRIVRVKLDEDWYDCEDSTGHVLILDDDGKPQPQWQVNLRDPLGIKTGSPLYDVLEGYMPAGVCFWAMETFDGPSPPGDDSDGCQGPYYEPLPFGVCCNEQSSSSPSSSSPSSSSPSSSSPSSSSPSSSSPSSSSPSSSSPSSHSPSSSSPSPSPSHSPSGSSSSKSTAIVPASWSPTGYAALYVAEMPDVRFDDVMVVSVAGDGEFPIDPRFLEVCEPNSLEVCGTAADVPVAVAAAVVGNAVRVRLAAGSPQTRLVIRLTGIRKGFDGQRFAPRTKAQFESNERFIRSAYER